MSTQADSKKVVIAALAGNLAIAICKFGAAFLSESTATMAEAVHSVADTGNQALLLLGMRLATKPVNENFAFGRDAERYFWPFVVALVLFSLGGAFGIAEGVSHALHNRAPGTGHAGSKWWSYGVLGLSLIFEAMSFRVAWKEFQTLSGGKPWRVAVREARDPTIPLVLAEDTTALVGLCIAFVSVFLADTLNMPWIDPIGSIAIGILLSVVAVALAQLTHGLLLGKSASLEEQGQALALAESVKGVSKVTQILSMHVGPDVIILAMKLAFDAGTTVEQAEEMTNEIERRIREKMPRMRKIFIEVDSAGDGRGVEAARKAWSGIRGSLQQESSN